MKVIRRRTVLVAAWLVSAPFMLALSILSNLIIVPLNVWEDIKLEWMSFLTAWDYAGRS